MQARNYYLSNAGNDNANGLSPESAWKSIAKLNKTSFSPGDSILFEAEGIWRETLVVKNSGKTGRNIVYSRYGNGKNPRIVGSEPADQWTRINGSVWKSGSSLDNPRDYYSGSLFIIQNDSVSWGTYKDPDASLSGLVDDLDWTYMNNALYLRSKRDPNTSFEAIELNQRKDCVIFPDNQPQNFIAFDGVDLLFARQTGFNAGYPAYRGATDLVFMNCTIGYIGTRGSGYAYGIAAWHSNFLVENCTITDCGRRGISINLYKEMPAGMSRTIRNVTIRNNVFRRGYHTTSLDLSSQQTKSDTIEGVYFYNNFVDDSQLENVERHWVSNQVFTQSGASYLNEIFIYNNIFIHATGRNILIEGGDSVFIWHNTIYGHNPNLPDHPYSNVGLNYVLKVDYRNNILVDDLPRNNIQNHGLMMYYNESSYIAKDYNLYFSFNPGPERNITAGINDLGHMGYTNSTKQGWDGYLFYNKKFDQHSPFPSDPLFKNPPYDFHLTEESPARNAGVKIENISSDFYGNPMNIPPDLGAVQFRDISE